MRMFQVSAFLVCSVIAGMSLTACEASVEAGYHVKGGYYYDDPVAYLYITNETYDYYELQYEGNHDVALCDGWDSWDAGWMYAVDADYGYELSLLEPGAQTCMVIYPTSSCDYDHCPFTLVGVPYVEDTSCHGYPPCMYPVDPLYRHTITFTDGPHQEEWIDIY